MWPKCLDIIEDTRPNSNQLADTDPEHPARTLQTHKTLKMLFPVFQDQFDILFKTYLCKLTALLGRILY